MNRQTNSNRKIIIIGLFLFIALIITLKLFYIQVIDKSYRLSASNNVIRHIRQYPARGLVFDRNEKLLICNKPSYDLMVIPNQISNLDTNEFCSLLNISKEQFIEKIEKSKNYSFYKSSVFENQISNKTFGYIQEKLFKFSGFFIQPRTLRDYPIAIAPHLLGYVGEVTNNDIKQDKYYKSGDYIGKSGIENIYEKELRGKKGVKIILVDVHNREKGSFNNARYDTLAEAGRNLYLTIDAELQEYGEKLMLNKKGSIVAIQPKTGEILAMISSPSYDPNLLIGKERSKNYNNLLHDSIKPLINRASTGLYPPGSAFKPVNALIGLQEKVISPKTKFSCQGPESTPIKCTHYHISPLNLRQAIEVSCNSYFWNVFKNIINNPGYNSVREAYCAWREYVLSFGFNSKFNGDLFSIRSGNVPSADYYDRIYGKGHWNALTIRSLAIGQGEILVTPVQLANLAAIIANKGYYYSPHLVWAIDNIYNKYNIDKLKHITKIDSVNFEPVIQGMYDVFEKSEGTAKWYKVKDLSICGKTGTVQNPHGKDHSIFIAFAPKDNPQIAISVIVENSGFGSTWAAPITTLMIEKYLNKTVKRKNVEQRIIDGNLISEN